MYASNTCSFLALFNGTCYLGVDICTCAHMLFWLELGTGLLFVCANFGHSPLLCVQGLGHGPPLCLSRVSATGLSVSVQVIGHGPLCVFLVYPLQISCAYDY